MFLQTGFTLYENKDFQFPHSANLGTTNNSDNTGKSRVLEKNMQNAKQREYGCNGQSLIVL